MIRHISVHGADHRNIVDALRGVREDIADLRAALAVPLELVWARKRSPCFALRPQIAHREEFPRVFLQ